MPVPEICAPVACAILSGAATVIEAPPLPPPVAATAAVSWFAPLSIVMVWPGLNPNAPATGIAVAPAVVAAGAVGLPAGPPDAMGAVSWFAPVSIVIVWPAAKSATPATLILVAPAAAPAGRVVAGCTRKSAQLLSVSTPSGKRPALRCGMRAPCPPKPPRPPPAPGGGTRHPPSPIPDTPGEPSDAHGSTSSP